MKLNGYEIEWFRKEINDTVMILDPITGDKTNVVRKTYQDPVALKLNGENVTQLYFKSIYDKKKNMFNKAEFADFEKKLTDKFLIKYPQVGDVDVISINNTLLDKEGNIVYYDITFGYNQPGLNRELSPEESTNIYNAISEIIDSYGKFKLNDEHKGKPVFVDRIATIRL